MNARIGTARSLVCISRPRRFGKSYAAKMLASYYDCSCDSHSLFDDKKIAGCVSYSEHLNRYNVINLDITGFISEAKTNQRPLIDVPKMIINAIREELSLLDPTVSADRALNDEMIRFVEKPDGKPLPKPSSRSAIRRLWSGCGRANSYFSIRSTGMKKPLQRRSRRSIEKEHPRCITTERTACAVSSNWLTTPTVTSMCSLKSWHQAKAMPMSPIFPGLIPMPRHSSSS